MAENFVRCKKCHEVFDAEEGPCPKCGTPYQQPVTQPQAFDGLYVDRYAGTDLVPVEEPVAAPRRRSWRENPTIFIGAGATLIGLGLVVAILFELGAVGGSAPTAPPVFGVQPHATPTPTLPAVIGPTLSQLEDPNFSAHMTVDSRVKAKPPAVPTAYSNVVKFDGVVAGGNQWGTLDTGSEIWDTRLIDGQFYRRTLPSIKWGHVPVVDYLVLCPLFDLPSTDYLELEAPVPADGNLLHFKTTSVWNPDISRLAMMDLSDLYIKPVTDVLDLYTTATGTPVRAHYSGQNPAADGSWLVDVEVDYVFTNVGVPQQKIDVPGPSWKPSPTSPPENPGA
jgi:hypothetical protein